MNKHFRMITLILLMALITACSNGNPGTTSDAVASDSSTTAGTSENTRTQAAAGETAQGNTSPSDDSATKTVIDAQGRSVEIPASPQRIVALWSVGEILALGEKPIGSSTNLLRFYTEEQRAGIEIVGAGAEGDLEKVMALQPDLIVISARATEDDIENYSKIAPTVTTPFFGDPFETFHTVANILNKQQEEEQWLSQYQSRVNEKRALTRDMNLAEQSALVIQFALKNIYTYKSSTFSVVFNDYQFKLTAKQEELQKDPAFGNLQLSLEVLPDFDADHLFVMISDEDSRQVYEDFTKSEVWNSMKAVKNKQVHLISNRMAINDVTTMDWALEEIYGLLHEQQPGR